MNVRLLFSHQHFNHVRHFDGDSRGVYSLADAYQITDLVTYPSRIEGFGNAFLEAIYYRRPLLMSRYEIFKSDISPKGFQVIGFDEFIDRQTVAHAREILTKPESTHPTVENNYSLGRRHYSYSMLRDRLTTLIEHSIQQCDI